MRGKKEEMEQDENEMKIMEGLEFKVKIVFLKKKNNQSRSPSNIFTNLIFIIKDLFM